MNKHLLSLSALLFLSIISACNNNDDDDHEHDPDLSGSLHAEIDGTHWSADPDKVLLVVTNTGSGTNIYLTATRVADSSHFSFLFPYFYGSDTTITEPSAGTDLRFQSNSAINGGFWLEETGTLNVSRTLQDGIETYTGTFSGTFADPIVSTDMITVTDGTFTAKRIL